jgi:hypothetical protein
MASTPERLQTDRLPSSQTPKLGRGVQAVNSNYTSNSINMSASKVVASQMLDLEEVIAKRKTELAGMQKSTTKKRPKHNPSAASVRWFLPLY